MEFLAEAQGARSEVGGEQGLRSWDSELSMR